MKNKLLLLLFSSALSFFACDENPYTQGKILYENFCSNCHMDDGSGLQGVIPPLAGADFVKNNPEQLPCIIKQGMSGKITVNGKEYDSVMTGAPQLTEFEITNIINYVNTAWGNNFPIVRHETVRAALKSCDPYSK
jgi:mono/diheme cytochrome c family protein